jgi:hypothetical protein
MKQPDPIAPMPINPAIIPNPVVLPRLRSGTSRHIEELLEETQLTQEEFAKEMGCDASTISRHIADVMRPRKKTLREYDATFSKLLKRKIVVNRNATKRK